MKTEITPQQFIEAFIKAVNGMVGQAGMAVIERRSVPEYKPIGIFSGARMKKCNVILQFSGQNIGLFVPLFMSSFVTEETEEGWRAGELCNDVSIGGKSIRAIAIEILPTIVGD